MNFLNTSMINLFLVNVDEYSSQRSLLVMTEKFKESIDQGNTFTDLLTDLLKIFIALITHF